MTLAEVVVALGISSLAVGGIVESYIFSATSAQKWALSLAASAKAMERIEETRSATWDTASWPIIDQLSSSNFPNQLVVLDLSDSGVPSVYATNVTQITQISSTPPLRRIRVDCIWTFKGNELFTNTIETCRAPDQ